LFSSNYLYVHMQYQKPEELLRFEQAVRVELAKVKSSGDGDIQTCNPSWTDLLFITAYLFCGFVSVTRSCFPNCRTCAISTAAINRQMQCDLFCTDLL